MSNHRRRRFTGTHSSSLLDSPELSWISNRASALFYGMVDGLDVKIHAKDQAQYDSFLLDLEALAREAGMVYTLL